MTTIHNFELDVRGEASPYPLLRTKQHLEKLQKGEVLKVIASNSVALQDIDAWSKKSGNELLGVEINGSTYNIFILKG